MSDPKTKKQKDAFKDSDQAPSTEQPAPERPDRREGEFAELGDQPPQRQS